MTLEEHIFDIPSEHEQNVFGQFDVYLKKIERTTGVSAITRDDGLKLLGSEAQVSQAKQVLLELLELSRRGSQITEQNVNYALAMAMEKQSGALLAIDNDLICHTISGKSIKPKTLGQKQYVDAIRDHMIVFGIGPAGTGKTYLAMAMAITAFKSGEVERIILTRPAIEAGEKLGFLPEAQNDMIFSIICEELGLFGGYAVIIMFVMLIWRFMVVANNAPDLFGALLVVGVLGHIAIQVILNIAVVTNTIPNTGISLPFISYGGSSVMFLLIEIGLVLSVARGIRLKDL